VIIYDALARYYDADHAAFDDDVQLYRELGRRGGGRVLEAMCGSGRLIAPLARAGLRVTGVDSSAAMLELARDRLGAAGLMGKVTLCRGDVREALPGGPFDLAIVALNSFMHLTTVADQLAALESLRAALVPGGLLALDMFNPSTRGLAELDGSMVLDRSFTLADGTRVQKFVVQRADMARQVNHVTFIYDELDREGRVLRTTRAFPMRWLYRFELEHLLARTGFEVDAVYGSYDLDEYEADSELMLTVARQV
jgi:SAM-dependent methyltransferase